MGWCCVVGGVGGGEGEMVFSACGKPAVAFPFPLRNY